MDESTTDVIETAPVLDASTEAVSAPADGEGSTPTATTAATTPVEETAKEAEAPVQVPENDDDLKGQENNPHVQAVIQLRQELRARNQAIDGYKALDQWKPVAEAIGDPVLAQSAHELVSAIHSPAPDNPSGFTSRPFLERLETESPGSVDQLFADTLRFQVPDEQGKPSTVVRELVKSWGLDPDRIDDYRNIDTLRASGIVTAEDISQVPEKYQPAFKSLSQPVREDLLSLKDTNPAAFEEYLRNAADALEARTWREKDEQAKVATAEREQQAFQQQLQQTVYSDLETESKTIGDSIHQNLSSQFKFSSDDAVNSLEITKILSVVANLQSSIPFYRDLAVKALKGVGVEPNGFAETLNRWEERRIAYKQFEAMGDKMQAQRALSESTLAKQQILAKANDYALRLAKASGERAAIAASTQNDQLAAASARFVPAGAGQVQGGVTNPYSANPHPVGSQEYYAFNRKIDREYSLTGASMFGGN